MTEGQYKRKGRKWQRRLTQGLKKEEKRDDMREESILTWLYHPWELEGWAWIVHPVLHSPTKHKTRNLLIQNVEFMAVWLWHRTQDKGVSVQAFGKLWIHTALGHQAVMGIWWNRNRIVIITISEPLYCVLPRGNILVLLPRIHTDTKIPAENRTFNCSTYQKAKQTKQTLKINYWEGS